MLLHKFNNNQKLSNMPFGDIYVHGEIKNKGIIITKFRIVIIWGERQRNEISVADTASFKRIRNVTFLSWVVSTLLFVL